MSYTQITKECLSDILQVSKFGKEIKSIEQLPDTSFKIIYNDDLDENLPFRWEKPHGLTAMGDIQLEEKRTFYIQVPDDFDAEEAARELREIYETYYFFVR